MPSLYCTATLFCHTSLCCSHLTSQPFIPSVRTPHLSAQDTSTPDLLAVLSRNLPEAAHDFIFGGSEATIEAFDKHAATREVTHISVYCVSTNRGQAAALEQLFMSIPSRFCVMQGDDFFKRAEGRYDTMGTDRLATLKGAAHLNGHPVLVFDGGTATTYSATDVS